MESYNATAELADKATADLCEQLLDDFAAYHPAAGRSAHGRAELIITVPAENLDQATRTALALVAGRPVVRLEVMATVEFDRIHGLPVLPELVSVTEAAELLGITRQAVLQRIDAGTLAASKVGTTYAIPRTAISQ